jgi:hypothetical protein
MSVKSEGSSGAAGGVAAVAEPGAAGPEETMGTVVRTAEVTDELVRRYDSLGLIKSRRDAYGRRMFPAGTGLLVKKLKAERMARVAKRGAG